jgi:hypothetical protein
VPKLVGVVPSCLIGPWFSAKCLRLACRCYSWGLAWEASRFTTAHQAPTRADRNCLELWDLSQSHFRKRAPDEQEQDCCVFCPDCTPMRQPASRFLNAGRITKQDVSRWYRPRLRDSLAGTLTQAQFPGNKHIQGSAPNNVRASLLRCPCWSVDQIHASAQ